MLIVTSKLPGVKKSLLMLLHTVSVFSIFIFSFVFIYASELQSVTDGSGIAENLEEIPSLLGKRSLELGTEMDSPLTSHRNDSDSHSFFGKRSSRLGAEMNHPYITLVSCLKGSTKRAPRHVSFEDSILEERSILEETTCDPNDPLADQVYMLAIHDKNFSLATDLRKQGLRLSNSDFVFTAVNEILKKPEFFKAFIDHLFNNQPHVFCQDYDCGINVFQDASQPAVNYFICRYPKSHGIIFNIFKEALRNGSNLVLDASFYEMIPVRKVWAMIDFAEEQDVPNFIPNCYLLPSSLNGINARGETVFTEAVNTMNTKRISWLLQRSDAADLMLSKNLKKENAITLAIKLFDKDLDPDYSVLLSLFTVIKILYKLNSFKCLKSIIKEFIESCGKREIIFEALDAELCSLIELLKTEIEADKSYFEFIDYCKSCLDYIYAMNLKHESLICEHDAESETETETDIDESESGNANNADKEESKLDDSLIKNKF